MSTVDPMRVHAQRSRQHRARGCSGLHPEADRKTCASAAPGRPGPLQRAVLCGRHDSRTIFDNQVFVIDAVVHGYNTRPRQPGGPGTRPIGLKLYPIRPRSIRRARPRWRTEGSSIASAISFGNAVRPTRANNTGMVSTWRVPRTTGRGHSAQTGRTSRAPPAMSPSAARTSNGATTSSGSSPTRIGRLFTVPTGPGKLGQVAFVAVMARYAPPIAPP